MNSTGAHHKRHGRICAAAGHEHRGGHRDLLAGLVPAGNEVANCVIRRCGADSRGAVGVFVAFSADTRVAHNVIYDLPYTGLSIGYRLDTTPTSQARCLAEYNHIHDVLKKLADGGGIYTLGFQPGTVLRGKNAGLEPAFGRLLSGSGEAGNK